MHIQSFPGLNVFGLGKTGSARPPAAAQEAAPAVGVSDQVGNLPSGFRLVAGDLKFEIPGGRQVTVGRLPDSDLQLQDGQVSRQHAVMHSRHGQLQICDRGSSNGTFLNGERLKPNQWYVVKAGSTLGMGETQFKLEGPDTKGVTGPSRQGLAAGLQAAQGAVGGIAGFVIRDNLGREFKLSQDGNYSLGRAQDNALKFQDPTVSGHHGEFQLRDGQLAFRDLKSTNGSQVNGQRLVGEDWVVLEKGSRIQMGSGTQLQVTGPLDLQSTTELAKVIDFRELIVDPQKQLEKYGQIVPDKPNAYWQNNAEARVRIREYLDRGNFGNAQELKACLLESHKLAVEGSSGQNRYYTGRHKQVLGADELPGGKFHEGVMGGVRNAESDMVSALALQYGDPYRNSLEEPAPTVRLKGISDEGCPRNMPLMGGQRHLYPQPEHFDEYFTQMQERLDKLARLPKNASKEEVLQNIAEFYQYGANVRPFRNVNNSLFMNFTNELLSRHGLKPVYHGILDHAAHRLQPEAFNRYFKDWALGQGQIG